MNVEASLEAAILGWVATHPERRAGPERARPLVEVLADEFGLEPNPETLDELAWTLARLEAQERIVLDAPVVDAVDVAPLDLQSPRTGGQTPGLPPPRVSAYGGLATAPFHVQLNWVLRVLRDRADPETGRAELDFRRTVQQLGLNPKDVRHALEDLRVVRHVGKGPGPDAETWWVDGTTRVTAAMLRDLRQPASPPAPPPAVTPERPTQPAALPPLADLTPLVDSLGRLEARFEPLIQQLVQAAESVHSMALSQAALLREQSQQIETLQEERARLLREAGELRRDNWLLKSGSSPAADELSEQAGRLQAAERRAASTGAEIDDKLRRVTRTLRETGEHQPGP